MNVKKLIFLLLFIVPTISFSQNLEYSKVLLVSTIDTVPSGKVWKITNVLPVLEAAGKISIFVNNSEIITSFTYGNNGCSGCGVGNNQNYYTGLNGAYWLPAGTSLSAGENTQYISVIEFNE